MNKGKIESDDFLMELYRQTEGDVNRQVSMQEIGAMIGLEKNEAGTLAEELIMEELVELKTLAGGIGITASGLDFLQKNGFVDSPAGGAFKLSGKSILEDDDRCVIAEILGEIREEMTQAAADYHSSEEIIIDIKTIEVQLLSSRPKTAIVLPVLKSLQQAMRHIRLERTAAKMDGMFARTL